LQAHRYEIKEAVMADELLFNRRWWWDPIDMEHLKVLDQNIQQQVLAAKLDAHAQLLKIQADAMTKISGLVAGSKQR
jgi:hypothetical protein